MKRDVNLSDVLLSESSFPLQISLPWPPPLHSPPLPAPSLLHINPLCLVSSLPTSALSLSSICIRNRIWGTMLSYHRSESERERVRKKDEGRVRSGGQETETLKENERRREEKRGQWFLSLCLHPSPVSNTGLVKHHGPNWTNDWAQIRPALMNKWMRK